MGGVLGPMGLGVFYDLSGGFALGLAAVTMIAILVMAGIVALSRVPAV